MELDHVDNASPVVRSKRYSLINQKVELDVGFDQRIKGTSHLTIFPEHPDLKAIVLNARQCEISKVTINGLKPHEIIYSDPCDTLSLHTDASVHQHHIIQEKLHGALTSPPEPELVIILPTQLKIEENPEFVVQTATGVKASKLSGTATIDAEAAEALADTAVSRYTRLEVIIEFVSIHTRDALHFACGPPGSGRWPHVYTRGGFLPGRASSLFPCIDSLYYRCTWEISITGPRTVGDALRQISGDDSQHETINGDTQAYEAKEMVFVCPGDITDDVVSKNDSSRRTVSYIITQNISAQHIGFAIGPFETVDLAVLRDADKLELLQENAAPIFAYCLPGRKVEVENTCLPTTEALDHFAITYAPYPFTSFGYCFVDDHPDQPAAFAGLAVCSSRMLYPENIIDPAQEVTRSLVQAVATQWLGIQIIPRQPEDTWVVLGSAIFITELFMKDLCGNNEHRHRMKMLSDRVCELDHERPSLWDMGALLHVDPAEYEFMTLKSPLVLYILDRRIAKTIGTTKMSISIGKFLSKARNEDLKENLLSTQDFCKSIEKILHTGPLDDFINQWVKGAGCPTFRVHQKFNKKKLVIEMEIRQVQAEINAGDRELEPNTFMRDVREEFQEVWSAPPQHVFTGPMTIRIHEADGTPYEHIIQIREAFSKFEVPYNTKYKRLKRGKKQRARNAARAENDDEQDTLAYCLGDILQTDEEIAEWKISEWSEEQENNMNAESYEWIRVDADFEWIANITLFMPGYMYASQLQQDRDVAAQLYSIQSISVYAAMGLISSILIRTVMDSRYFHAVRTAAVELLVKHASDEKEADMIGLFHLRSAYEELFCVKDGDSVMTRPNDFSDQLSYRLQCDIITAISKVRDKDGHSPHDVKTFLLDKLKFNDNSQNDYSDAYYVSTLLKALTDSLLARAISPADEDMDDDFELQLHWAETRRFEQSCLDEIDRYRRMDEWTSSYQNLYSRTAVECQARLSQGGLGKYTTMHFLQYARPGNYEMLRCSAYNILASTDLFTHPRLLECFVHGMVTVGSPYIRTSMRVAFGNALARKALGIGKPGQNGVAQSDGLTVEGAPAAAQAPDHARRTTVEGALGALKKELADDYTLQQALWKALTHPNVGYEDVRAMVDFCAMLYDKKDNGRVSLQLPRYWRIDLVGKGKLKFSRSKRVRRKKFEPWKPKVTIPLNTGKPSTSTQGPSKSGLKLTIKRQNSTSVHSPAAVAKAKATPTPPPSHITTQQSQTQRAPTPQQQQQQQQPRQILKLKINRSSLSGQ